MAHGPLLQVAPVVGQGAAGALQRLAEGLLRQGAASMLRHKSGHLPQLLRHIGHRLRRILPGHIHGEVGHAPPLGRPAEGELIGVARQRGAEHEAGRRHHAALRQAQQNLMIGAVALRHAVVLGGGDKRALGGGGDQIAGQPLGQHGGDPQGVEDLAGQKDAHTSRLAGLVQGADHGTGGGPLHVTAGARYRFGRQMAHLEANQTIGRAQQRPRPLRVLRHLGRDRSAQRLDQFACHGTASSEWNGPAALRRTDAGEKRGTAPRPRERPGFWMRPPGPSLMKKTSPPNAERFFMEQVTRLELATSTLARWRSTR